jgi:SAM-dependent methyltransferase
VNHHEATAYCAWRSRVDGVDYHLPSEAQHHLMRAAGGRANNNLEFGSESAPMPPNELGLSDVFGNVWQWCADDFNPLPGSRPHPYYDDFSTPCYDGDHRIILGGSFISTGDEASPWARFHFRPHFLQQAGIRLVSSTDQGKPYRYARDGYESEEMLDRYLLLHYGTVSESLADGLPRESVGFPQRIAERLVRVARDHDVPLRRALDAGCAVGGATFALSKHFDEVVGIDASRRFIDAATRLARTGTLAYLRRDGAGRTSPLTATVEPRARRDRTRFEWGDLTDLDSGLGAFDALLVSNVLCRLSRPRAFLDRLTSLLLPGGVVLFATPWSWSDEHTPESQWVDGVEALADALGPEYQLIGRDDELATLRIHARRYEVIRPEITIWHRDRASTR